MQESESFNPDLLLQVKALPTRAGVYIMRDLESQVLYIGKAKNLRARVRSYFKGNDLRPQIQFLIKKIAKIETIVADTENQAFILERDLIGKHKPRYNIKLKDNKEYISIRLDRNSEWPRIQLVRQVKNDGAQYFGPYSFSYELKRLLDLIKRVVPLRTCSDTVFYNRQRPCLEYQIKRCCAPCCLPVERSDYAGWIKQAIAILEGRSEKLLSDLEFQMLQASEQLRFEDAAVLRDRLNALQSAKDNRVYLSNRSGSQDIVGVYRQQDLAAISILRVDNGRIKESCNYAFVDVVSEDNELVEAVLSQFYESGHGLVDEVVLDLELPSEEGLKQVLKSICGVTPDFIYPQRGASFRLLQLAKLNAQQHFSSEFEEESKMFDLAVELARLLKLKQVPRRIECIDISNLQGSDIVGALVCFVDGKFNRDLLKKYNISFQGKADDFAAIFEVVTRRLKNAEDLPDLLIIDGGPQQLAKALEARDLLGVSLEIVSLAKIKEKPRSARLSSAPLLKKPERFFLEGNKLPIELDAANPLTHFVQRIRDEVHKQVLGFHRLKRSKRAFASVLDGVIGIGPDKRKRLLASYGSIQKIKEATAEDIARDGRMPLTLARKLLEVLSKVPKDGVF
jgi:excinuclease ABC subunit C